MTSKKPPRTGKMLPPEWSHLIDADKIGANPMKINIEAGPEERKLLAQRFGVKALDSLKAKMTMVRAAGKMTVHVTGSLVAEVNQDCVVTGKPVKDTITEDFEAFFADRNKTVPLARARQEKEVQQGKLEMPIMDESDDPEAMIEGKIDAGELVSQYLSLAINPYPHAEGVEYENGDDDGQGPKKEDFDNPFAALRSWKAKKGKE